MVFCKKNKLFIETISNTLKHMDVNIYEINLERGKASFRWEVFLL